MKILVLTDDEAGELRCTLNSAILNTDSTASTFSDFAPAGVLEVWKRSNTLRHDILDKLNAETPTPPMTPQVAAWIKENLRKLYELHGKEYHELNDTFNEALSIFGLVAQPYFNDLEDITGYGVTPLNE